MRKILLALAAAALVAAPLQPGRAADLPEFQPALMGTHGAFHRSLINLIDAEGLVKKGQKDAVVFFTCAVKPDGNGGQILVYRGTPGSDLLQRQLLRLSYRAEFSPAVFEHHAVPVNLGGTVVFVVRDGKPHLRIYLHQQEEDFKTNADFVAPQLALVTGKQKYLRPEWPKDAPKNITGAVALVNVEVDLHGNVKNATVAFEHPEGLKLGEAALKFVHSSNFVPGYRNGQMVDCKFDFPVFWFKGRSAVIQ